MKSLVDAAAMVLTWISVAHSTAAGFTLGGRWASSSIRSATSSHPGSPVHHEQGGHSGVDASSVLHATVNDIAHRRRTVSVHDSMWATRTTAMMCDTDTPDIKCRPLAAAEQRDEVRPGSYAARTSTPTTSSAGDCCLGE